MARRIRCNAAGNWIGYVGHHEEICFGGDTYHAFYWLRTGIDDGGIAWDDVELAATEKQWQIVKSKKARTYISEKDFKQ